MSLAVANSLAEEKEVDLVEIAPTAQPPVCRLMDYGKFKYRESKKRHEAKLKQKQIQVKEVKFRPGTDEGDYQIKLRNLIRFLEEGDKTKITLRFRGREMAHQEFGVRLLERIKAELEPLRRGRAVPEDGRAADDHGAVAEEEVAGKQSQHSPARAGHTSDVRVASASPGATRRQAKNEGVVMPKMKTKRGAAKRFRAQGSGGIKRTKAFLRHILTKKSTKRKRNMRGTTQVHAADVRAVRAMLPYA